MPIYSYLIMISFGLIILCYVLMIAGGITEKRVKLIATLHYFLAAVSGIFYFVATILVLVNQELGLKFKNEVVTFALMLVISFLIGYFSRVKQQRLLHYFAGFVLVIMVIFFHLKWSGLI
ncbi:MAG: hypothetical protein WC480_01525 [Patescibacteria group bacterium]